MLGLKQAQILNLIFTKVYQGNVLHKHYYQMTFIGLLKKTLIISFAQSCKTEKVENQRNFYCD